MLDCAPEMDWDIIEMETAVVSLLKNAIEAIPKEGTIEIGCKNHGDYVDLSVTDSGTGIPIEVLPRVFSPLVTSKAKGMGMGLAISKRIVEAHYGKIFFESIPGKGTTFTIRLLTTEKLQFILAEATTVQSVPKLK
jgi:signal transduction histidine kinase